MKNLLIGYYGYSNFGDDAMLLCITSHNVGQNTALCISECTPKINGKITTPRGRYLPSLFLHTRRSDRVIWGGGTCFYGGKKNQLFLLIAVLMARLSGKPFLFYGVGIDKFSSALAERIAQLSMYLCSQIYTRDRISLEYASKIKPCAKLVADPFLALPQAESNTKNNSILINLTLTYITNEDLINLISDLKKKFDRVVAISLNSSDPEESRFLEHIRAHHPSVETAPYAGIDRTISLFNSAQSFIGYRLHGMILCMLSGTGFLTYNYQDKVQKAAIELKINPKRIINEFSKINIELLRTPEERRLINELHTRAIDEIKGI